MADGTDALIPLRRLVTVKIDGADARVPEGATLLDAAKSLGIETPTLCFAANLTPANACRVCVVELEGARTLVPSCARKVEPGMVVKTDSPRVRDARRMVLELLGSTVDMSATPRFAEWCARYDAHPERFGAPAPRAVTDDNALFVRDYAKCILCFKCVEACGDDAQHTYAIAVAGRGAEATIATESENSLPDSACVFCGNCIGVCPTAALQFRAEHDLRVRGEWREAEQTQTDTICPYCGVGCTLTLHVQDDRIVKVTSPESNEVTHGQLCVKGRFGFEYLRK